VIVSTATWPTPTATTWRPAREEDGPALAELRAQVLRDSLERVGRYDEVRVRERFLVGFDPTHTHVLVGAEPLGSIALRPEPEGSWLEHFYLSPALQGAGVGGGVLRAVVAAADRTSACCGWTCCSAATLGACTNVTGSSSTTRTRSTCSSVATRDDHPQVRAGYADPSCPRTSVAAAC